MAAEAFEQLASFVHNEAPAFCRIYGCWRLSSVAEWTRAPKRLTVSLECLPIHPSQYVNDIQSAAKISVVNQWHGDTQFESRMRWCLPDEGVQREVTLRES